MDFQFQRLEAIRTNLGITKAEAARRLNMSAMGYGRYEKGEREPSFQTVRCIAETFNTSTDYLYGHTDDAQAVSITISIQDDPELFSLINSIKNDKALANRLISYYKSILSST